MISVLFFQILFVGLNQNKKNINIHTTNIQTKLVINNKKLHLATEYSIKCSQIPTEANGGINETAIAIPTILSSNFSYHKNIKAIIPDSNATTKSTTVGVPLSKTCSVIHAKGTK